MARFRRGVSHKFARKVANKASQKTKVKCIVSLLDFAGGSIQTSDLAVASDTTRANYFDVTVKPFSTIQVLHLDLAIYQTGSSVIANGLVDWALFKNPAGSLTPSANVATGAGLTWVPYTFKTSRAAVPMFSPNGLPTVYHLSGDIKIPPRFQIMAPGDKLTLGFVGLATANVTYSVNGTVTYMFKV